MGILDLDNISQSKRTRDFLNAAEKAGIVSTVGLDIPKTVILYNKGGKTEVILAQTAAATIAKRTLRKQTGVVYIGQ